VESLDVPAPAPVAKNEVSVETQNAIVRHKHGRYSTTIKLACSATGADDCEGRLTLLTKKRFRVHGVKTQLVLGSVRYDVAPGATKTVTVKLQTGVKKLAKKGFVNAVAQTADANEALALVVRK
jgi:hypothetical protein